jgi:hypothetical protein
MVPWGMTAAEKAEAAMETVVDLLKSLFAVRAIAHTLGPPVQTN